MTELARVTTLEDLAAVLRIARARRGMSQLLLDERSGLASGHTAKIECGIKGLGKTSVPLILGALNVELAVMLGPAQHRDENAEKSRKQHAHWGRAGRQKQLRLQTPKQRSKIARAAAKARWRKSERERT